MIQEQLLELYDQVFQQDSYPPLTGKILGLFYISKEKYFSLEEIINLVGEDKKTVMKALRFLRGNNEINYDMLKESPRERQFYLNIQGAIDKLSKRIGYYKLLNNIFSETMAIREDKESDLSNFMKNFMKFNEEVLQYVEEKMKDNFELYSSKE